MIQKAKREKIISALLIIGVLYFSFMILDRILSIIYGFNFQPYGPNMPMGFTFWGHIFNASMVALGGFLTFKLYDYGKEKKTIFLQVLPFIIIFTIGAVIPYLSDAAYLIKHGVGNTIPLYLIANDLYVFLWAVLIFKIVKSNKKRVIILVAAFMIFLLIHFFIYTPMFPKFYWS